VVVSEVVSVVGSTVEEDEVDSEAAEVASRTEGAMVVVGEVLATKEVVGFHPEEVEEIAVGMEDPTEAPTAMLPQMLQPVQVAEVEVVSVEEALLAPVLQIAMVLACQRQLVGMIRVVAVAHMMTDLADTVAVEASTIVMELVEVVAIWSR